MLLVYSGLSGTLCQETNRAKGPSKYREGHKFTTGMFHLELEVHVGHSNFFNLTPMSGKEHGIFAWSRDRPLPIPEYRKMPLFHKCHTYFLPPVYLPPQQLHSHTHKITIQHHHHEGPICHAPIKVSRPSKITAN